jgi:predicted ATPase
VEELRGVLAATAAGGRAVLLAGEAGVGKSALVRRFTERQSADARFLLGACDPLLTPRALGPLHDIARQTGGRLAELLASAGPREAVFAAFLDQLTQPPRPRVVVVEDGALGRRGDPGPAGVPGASAGGHPGDADRHLP